MASPLHEPPGWFGKLPMLGDFAHRRLPADVVQHCDAWLSPGMTASRRVLGDAWLDSYLSAPLWCFAWAPGIVDASWWLGVLMPSVDAVGRYFPLVVLCDAAYVPGDARTWPALDGWYAAVGRCALATLAPQATLEQFEAALAGVSPPLCGAPIGIADAGGRAAAVADEDGERYLDVPDAAAWLVDAPAIALQTVMRGLQGHSIWWPVVPGAAARPARVSLMPGLPEPERFVGLLQGQP